MKEFKSAHSRMFNKRRANNAAACSTVSNAPISNSNSNPNSAAAANSDEENDEAVNKRNYSPRMGAAPSSDCDAAAAAAKDCALAATKSAANNNGPKKGSISGLVGSLQIATAN